MKRKFMMFNTLTEKFKSAIKTPLILYLDIYPYYVANDGQLLFLLLKRLDTIPLPGTWQALSGKLKEGETIRDGFFRQILEKTGENSALVYKLDFINHFYDDLYDTIMMAPCAAAQLHVQDIKIDFTLHNEFRWVTLTEAVQLVIWENQRQCLNLIQQCHTTGENTLKFRRLH